MTGTAHSESHAHTTLRPVRVQGVAERGPGSGRGRRPRHGPRAPPYDRNKFLAANFSFLVSDGASLEAATADADMPLEWEDVLQVIPPAPPHLPLGSVRALESQSLQQIALPKVMHGRGRERNFAPISRRSLCCRQVNMQTSEAELTCPIALGPPVAPQITPCGECIPFLGAGACCILGLFCS